MPGRVRSNGGRHELPGAGRRPSTARRFDDRQREEAGWEPRLLDAGTHHIPVRIYRPGSDPYGWLVRAHGGSWQAGSVEYWHGPVMDPARVSGCTVVSTGYRLAPRHQHPAQLDDVLTVLGRSPGGTAKPCHPGAHTAKGAGCTRHRLTPWTSSVCAAPSRSPRENWAPRSQARKSGVGTVGPSAAESTTRTGDPAGYGCSPRRRTRLSARSGKATARQQCYLTDASASRCSTTPRSPSATAVRTRPSCTSTLPNRSAPPVRS
ncbi:alpha/beta hydrolase [Streptomyces spinoverrucosus]|nr:alpha/beta hydrolase [Streptomyces spinoverrucosus]